MEIIGNIAKIYHRFGVWVLLIGSMSVLLSTPYLDSPAGNIFFVLGVLLLISDPAILIFVGQDKVVGDDTPRDRSLYFVWGILFLSLVIFYIRGTLNVPVDKVSTGGDAFITRLRYLLLLFFVLTYLGAILWRLLLCLGYSSRQSLTVSLQAQKKEYLNKSLITILAVISLLVLINYVSSIRNPFIDMTSEGYFTLSESARTIISNVDKKVRIYVFLPVQQQIRRKEDKANRGQNSLQIIAEDVRDYMGQLPGVNSRITIEERNADLESETLTDFGAVTNGTIILRVNKEGLSKLNEKPYIERRVFVHSERDMDKLEVELVRALIQISSKRKTIYFTASHGERFNFSEAANFLEGVELFKDELRFFNNYLKVFQPPEWPGKVPEDADALVILGPRVSFKAPAREALKEYIKRNGKVFIAIDPAGKEDFNWLLAEGEGTTYKFHSETLTNMKTRTGVMFTDSVSDHRLTQNLRLTLQQERFIYMPRTGYFEEIKASNQTPGKTSKTGGVLAGLTPTKFLHSPGNTWLDKNKNGLMDGAEKKARYNTAIAYEKAKPAPPEKPLKPGEKPAPAPEVKPEDGPRLVIYSGVDWLSNRSLKESSLQKNLVLAADTVAWLTENPLASAIKPKKRTSRNKRVTDKLKFRNILLGIVFFPLGTGGLLFAGIYIYRRNRNFIEPVSESDD